MTVYEVRVTVTHPDPQTAEWSAGGIAEMVRTEFGDSMKLDISVTPVEPETLHQAFQRRQTERAIALWNETHQEQP